MKTFRDLQVWQRGMDLAQVVYECTRGFPDSERFGLTSQMRRAAVSVPSNVAEGQARGSRKEFVQFLLIAKGSLAELETQVELASRLGYAPAAEFGRVKVLVDEEGRLLNGLIRAIRTLPAPRSRQPATGN